MATFVVPHELAGACSELSRVLRLEFFGLKRCGDIGDAHPRFNVVGDDFKVAYSGGVNFPRFDGVA
jgi:hypothetical protein